VKVNSATLAWMLSSAAGSVGAAAGWPGGGAGGAMFSAPNCSGRTCWRGAVPKTWKGSYQALCSADGAAPGGGVAATATGGAAAAGGGGSLWAAFTVGLKRVVAGEPRCVVGDSGALGHAFDQRVARTGLGGKRQQGEHRGERDESHDPIIRLSGPNLLDALDLHAHRQPVQRQAVRAQRAARDGDDIARMPEVRLHIVAGFCCQTWPLSRKTMTLP